MDVKTFATELARALAKRGIPGETAVKHAVGLVRTFDEEDLREIASYTSQDQFDELSDSLAQLIKDKEAAAKKPRNPAPSGSFHTQVMPSVNGAATGEFKILSGGGPKGDISGATIEIPVQSGEPSESAGSTEDHMKTKAFAFENGDAPTEHTVQFDGLHTSDISVKEDTASDMTVVNIPACEPYTEEQEIYLNDDDDDDIEKDEKVVLTKRGKKFFWGISISVSPVAAALAALIAAVFVFGIVVICALIVASLLLVCAEAVAGSGFTLVGVIYGAIEIVSGNVGIGIYEIGLGICCGALALCLGILTYNFAVVALPYTLKRLITFEGYCIKRVGPMMRRFREECNRL